MPIISACTLIVVTYRFAFLNSFLRCFRQASSKTQHTHAFCNRTKKHVEAHLTNWLIKYYHIVCNKAQIYIEYRLADGITLNWSYFVLTATLEVELG